MQKRRFTIFEISDLSRYKKLRIRNLRYFDFNYESKYNKFIINFKYYIYYRDIFV